MSLGFTLCYNGANDFTKLIALTAKLNSSQCGWKNIQYNRNIYVLEKFEKITEKMLNKIIIILKE